MLITKSGLDHPVYVIDPEGAQLVAKGEWREATDTEAGEFTDFLAGHPELTSREGQIQAARDAGLDPTLVLPSQVIHTTPQTTSADDAVNLGTATGINSAPTDGEFSVSNDYAATSEVRVTNDIADRAEADVKAHNAEMEKTDATAQPRKTKTASSDTAEG